MTSFSLSYDYRCPFAKNIHLHVIAALRAGGDFDVTFVPWTMSQGYREPGAPDVWLDAAKDGDLLALAVSTSVRDQQPDLFLDVHEALFLGRHVRGLRLASWDDIETALSGIAVDLDAVRADVAARRPHEVIGAAFRTFETYEAFGVPTFVLGNDAVFVRYMNPPQGDDAASVDLIGSITRLIAERAALNEFKHTKVPF